LSSSLSVQFIIAIYERKEIKQFNRASKKVYVIKATLKNVSKTYLLIRSYIKTSKRIERLNTWSSNILQIRRQYFN
ncbi:hypothetical protein, partial [Lactobacillus helveticus]